MSLTATLVDAPSCCCGLAACCAAVAKYWRPANDGAAAWQAAPQLIGRAAAAVCMPRSLITMLCSPDSAVLLETQQPAGADVAAAPIPARFDMHAASEHAAPDSTSLQRLLAGSPDRTAPSMDTGSRCMLSCRLVCLLRPIRPPTRVAVATVALSTVHSLLKMQGCTHNRSSMRMTGLRSAQTR